MKTNSFYTRKEQKSLFQLKNIRIVFDEAQCLSQNKVIHKTLRKHWR